jgi:hypothetical protein
MPALVLNTILATALIAFDAAGDPLTLSTTLALLSTFVYVFGRRPEPCGQAPRGPYAVLDRLLDGEAIVDRERRLVAGRREARGGER